MADKDQAATAAVNVVSKMDDESSDAGPAAPRENMIATAIRFLQNPKVRESPFAQRKTFLTRKGLTAEEIEIAIARSGTAEDEHKTPPTSVGVNKNLVPQSQVPPPVQSAWSVWRDRASTVIVIGSLSYGIYHLIKKYILPLWLGPSEEEKRSRALQDSMQQLQQTLQSVVSSLQEVQSTSREQQEQLRQVILNTASSRGPMEHDRIQQQHYVSEIKGEIQSLKGILLSRKQFPPTPKPTPVLPSWQLGTSTSASSDIATNGAEGSTDSNEAESTSTGEKLTSPAGASDQLTKVDENVHLTQTDAFEIEEPSETAAAELSKDALEVATGVGAAQSPGDYAH